MKPKQYAVAVYYGTKTFEVLSNTSVCVLQLLSQTNIDLVRPLGKKSGTNFDKNNYLCSKNKLSEWNGHAVLKDACAYLDLEKISQLNTGGDHELFIFQVSKSKTIKEDEVLMFQDLVKKGIIL